MQVAFRSAKLKKTCSVFRNTVRAYGQQMAEMIHARMKQIEAFDTVEVLIEYGIGKCHPLTGDRKGQYAMNLTKNWRLVFSKQGDQIQIACIEEIEDYHGD